ncbi:hypothetical protein [Lewinella sp. JB7]|uniref:hypothetical protein n=1 Tax=Lewinella sp. JB7 TaxID=2962887 RepID=UPI0020CA1111|nr:hypothetical protein [Lewinella sp. JB7]MCP9237469.1 hypothetical protein [Lewinella sp. JB7]
MAKASGKGKLQSGAATDVKAMLRDNPSFVQPFIYTTGDLQALQSWGETLAPIVQQTAKGYAKGTLLADDWAPSEKDWKRVAKELPEAIAPYRKMLGKLRGSEVTKEEWKALTKIGLARARKGMQAMLPTDSPFARILAANLAADGTYTLTGPTLTYHSPMGPQLPLAQMQISTRDEVAKGLLSLSIIAEVIGLIGALVGISFPKVDLVKLSNKLGARTRSRLVFRQIDKLFKVLQNKQKSLADKLEAILDFVNRLSRAGIISDVAAGILSSMSWWEIGASLVMLAAQLVLLSNPATASALAAKKAIALGSAIYALAKKGLDLGRLYAAEQT